METEQCTRRVSVIWRGKKFIVEIDSHATLEELGSKLLKLTNIKPDTMRLIVSESSTKSSKLLSPFSDEYSHLGLQDTSILEGKSIRMMGASEHEVDEVLQSAKTNSRIAGFDEEEKRLRQRMLNGPHASLKLPQGNYIFFDFRTLHIPGIELNPPASEALKRMHMLAADPGIVAVMNKHRWCVGIMTEMAPIGYVGVSPKCILGFNKNQGEEISLRLRTDDLKGFRKYESIKKTLLHELAHMKFSEHDANFYALDKQLNEEATSLDWTKSRSHTLEGVKLKHTEHQREELYFKEQNSYKLGGESSNQLPSARGASVVAAHRRLANSHREPDPDDSVSKVKEDFGHIYTVGKEKLVEPYNEPDPDDFVIGEAMKTKINSGTISSEITCEPDSIDVELIRYVRPVATDGIQASVKIYEGSDHDNSLDSNHFGHGHIPSTKTLDTNIQTQKALNEFDPDDSEAELNNVGHGNTLPHIEGDFLPTEAMEVEIDFSKTCSEPDPDASANDIGRAEPDPDDALVPPNSGLSKNNDDLDPNDAELQRIQDPVTVVCNRLDNAIRMLQSEVDPTELATVLQTLFKIIRNLTEHPEEIKFKKLRMANPVFQRNVANYKAAMEVLSLVGFMEEVVRGEIGMAETYLVLKRNDPGLLWLAKSSLETCNAH